MRTVLALMATRLSTHTILRLPNTLLSLAMVPALELSSSMEGTNIPSLVRLRIQIYDPRVMGEIASQSLYLRIAK
jgi:hypothetical protein